MVLFFVIFNFLLSVVAIHFQPLALAANDEVTAGSILAFEGVGMLVGGLAMSLWGGTRRRAAGMVGFCLSAGGGLVIMGLRQSNGFLAVGLLVYSLSMVFLNTHWQILIQSKVGLELQGRVFSINEMMAFCLRPISMLISAPLCERLLQPFLAGGSAAAQLIGGVIGIGKGRAIGLLFIVFGLLIIAWTFFGLQIKSLMRMEDILPNAIPGNIIFKDKDKMQEMQLRAG
jgi:hypothetical protein